MTALRVIAQTIGILLLVWSLLFLFLGVTQHGSVFAPLAFAALGVLLIRLGPRMPKGAENRIQAYLNGTPSAKRLWLWSKWLGWSILPLVFGWTYLAISEFPQLGLAAIFGGAFVIALPSLVLTIVVLHGYYRAARARAIS